MHWIARHWFEPITVDLRRTNKQVTWTSVSFLGTWARCSLADLVRGIYYELSLCCNFLSFYSVVNCCEALSVRLFVLFLSAGVSRCNFIVNCCVFCGNFILWSCEFHSICFWIFILHTSGWLLEIDDGRSERYVFPAYIFQNSIENLRFWFDWFWRLARVSPSSLCKRSSSLFVSENVAFVWPQYATFIAFFKTWDSVVSATVL
jgi:hypothetical protein